MKKRRNKIDLIKFIQNKIITKSIYLKDYSYSYDVLSLEDNKILINLYNEDITISSYLSVHIRVIIDENNLESLKLYKITLYSDDPVTKYNLENSINFVEGCFNLMIRYFIKISWFKKLIIDYDNIEYVTDSYTSKIITSMNHRYLYLSLRNQYKNTFNIEII